MSVFTDTPQWALLQARINTQRVPHALLLSGSADGLMNAGKIQFTRYFAASLLCDACRTDTGLACGGCDACRLFAAGSHGDYLQVVPEEGSRVIKIHQIRALCEELGLTSQRGGYRVAVIAPADAMLGAAANGLLKTLEEPRPGVVIILISAKMGAIPMTIRSRCQRLRLNGVRDIRVSADDGQSVGVYLPQWRDGLMRRCDYMSIAAEWSKVDYEPIFEEIFSWLAARIRQSFAKYACAMGWVDRQKSLAFYDNLLAAHQFVSMPGASRRALYEKLFIEAQALIPHLHGNI